MTTDTDTQECQAAFEQGFSPDGRGLEKDTNGNYKFMTAYAAWGNFRDGWQARAEWEGARQKALETIAEASEGSV